LSRKPLCRKKNGRISCVVLKNPEKSYVAFCVLGGIFSEGIDLKGSRLIGAWVVGVGLRNSMFSKILSGITSTAKTVSVLNMPICTRMNKVLQAAGG
jgi:hypothetical protein